MTNKVLNRAPSGVRWRLLWLISLVVWPGPLMPQVPAVRFEHLSVDDGLSHSAVFDIEQDRYGFLWLATPNGLNRYDGYSMRVFRHDPEDPTSLSDNYVKAILEDRQGRFFIGTEKGLDHYLYGEQRFVHYRHDPEDPASLSHNSVKDLYEDRAGNLWIVTPDGLNRLREEAAFDRFYSDPGNEASLSDSRVTAVTEDRQGRLWVGTHGGLDLFDRPSATWQHFRHDPEDPSSLSHDLVNAILEDADGHLWIGTASGLNRFDLATETFRPYRQGTVDLSQERILELFLDRDKDLWVGTLNAGLIHIPRGGGAPSQYRNDAADPWSLNGDRVFSIFEDRSGIFWFGTWAGLNKYDRRLEQFAIYRREPGRESTLSDSNVSAVLEDRDGRLWVGTWDKGLNRVDRGSAEVLHYKPDPDDPGSLPDDTVQALFEDRSGAIWVATWGGLARLDRGEAGFTVYRPDPGDPASLDSEAVMSVYEDRQGQVWVGTTLGLSRYEPETGGFLRYRSATVPEHLAASILEDRAGSLWYASTAEGVFQLTPATGASPRGLINYRHDPADSDSLSSNRANYLYEDRSGRLWVGTGAGLDRLDPSRQGFFHYRESDGLASNQVLGILEDETGHIWLSTSNGLSRLDPRTGSFESFGVEDGLQSNVFSFWSAFRSARGEMFFGGIHGLNAFFPDQIRSDTFVPPVLITDFQLFNASVPPRRIDPRSPLERSILDTTEIHLSHRHTVFSLEFAALHFASPEKSRYAYRLEGFDADWILTDAQKRFATYTNLDAGTYRFRVRGSNSDGVWSDKEAGLQIVVAPPPWKSWWAYAFYTLALAAAVWGAILAQKRKLEQERAVSARLREVDRLKDEFLANTSHELRTPLYGITGLAESLIDGAAGEISPAARSNLAMIVASGRRLSHLVNDILDFEKLKHKSLDLHTKPVDLHALTDVVLALSRPLVGMKDLVLKNSVAKKIPAVLADENRLHQILHNLVGNALKFTEEGSVEVGAEVRGDEVFLRVTDTGIGIPEDRLDRIFEAFEQADASTEREFGGTGLGLAVTRRLVELHGGNLSVESTLELGSTFFFTLPIASEESEGTVLRPPRSALSEMPISVDAPEEATPPADPSRPPRAHPASILVVDDEPVNRQVLANQLTAEGYLVRQATNGPEALASLQEESVDLVLLDVMMPRMSGYEVCRTLRERYSIDDLPVIFLTAKSQVEDLVVGLAAGANDYLPKPIARDELIARVKTHLGILRIHRRLARLVEERTVEVRQRERLLEERERLIRELEASNAELARFNYTVSHDLKNPVVTIRNFLGLARRDTAAGNTEGLEQNLERLEQAAEIMHRQLEELYEFSRLSHLPLASEKVHLDELVNEVLTDLSGSIKGRQVEVASQRLPVVCGDRARLLELVRHLLHNALDHMGDPPSPRIEIGARWRTNGSGDGPEPGDPVIYVRDNGLGIDPRYHEKIFGLFEQLDPAASTGTGIGLALVKRIVEVHEGQIWVESEGRGQGSTFCFTLPRHVESQSAS